MGLIKVASVSRMLDWIDSISINNCMPTAVIAGVCSCKRQADALEMRMLHMMQCVSQQPGRRYLRTSPQSQRRRLGEEPARLQAPAGLLLTKLPAR